MLSVHGPYTLRIASGGTESPLLSTQLGYAPAKIGLIRAINIQAPAALTGTVTLLMGAATYQEAAADLALPAAKAKKIEFPIVDFKLKSSGAEAANRDFTVTFVVEED